MSGQITFRELDGNIPLPDPTSALEIWYVEVRDTKLADLKIRDLCRACRQRLYIEIVVPVALKQLAGDLLAGELYDGELINALRNIPAYWREHPTERLLFLALAQQAYKISHEDEFNFTEEDLIRMPGY
jgi:hypothetical protein